MLKSVNFLRKPFIFFILLSFIFHPQTIQSAITESYYHIYKDGAGSPDDDVECPAEIRQRLINVVDIESFKNFFLDGDDSSKHHFVPVTELNVTEQLKVTEYIIGVKVPEYSPSTNIFAEGLQHAVSPKIDSTLRFANNPNCQALLDIVEADKNIVKLTEKPLIMHLFVPSKISKGNAVVIVPGSKGHRSETEGAAAYRLACNGRLVISLDILGSENISDTKMDDIQQSKSSLPNQLETSFLASSVKVQLAHRYLQAMMSNHAILREQNITWRGSSIGSTYIQFALTKSICAKFDDDFILPQRVILTDFAPMLTDSGFSDPDTPFWHVDLIISNSKDDEFTPSEQVVLFLQTFIPAGMDFSNIRLFERRGDGHDAEARPRDMKGHKPDKYTLDNAPNYTGLWVQIILDMVALIDIINNHEDNTSLEDIIPDIENILNQAENLRINPVGLELMRNNILYHAEKGQDVSKQIEVFENTIRKFSDNSYTVNTSVPQDCEYTLDLAATAYFLGISLPGKPSRSSCLTRGVTFGASSLEAAIAFRAWILEQTLAD